MKDLAHLRKSHIYSELSLCDVVRTVREFVMTFFNEEMCEEVVR